MENSMMGPDPPPSRYRKNIPKNLTKTIFRQANFCPQMPDFAAKCVMTAATHKISSMTRAILAWFNMVLSP